MLKLFHLSTFYLAIIVLLRSFSFCLLILFCLLVCLLLFVGSFHMLAFVSLGEDLAN